MDKINKEDIKVILFPIIKESLSNRLDIDSENRRNKVDGLTGEKIFMKTYHKFLDEKFTFTQALVIINNSLNLYLEWLDELPIELLLISKRKAGYKKVKNFINNGEIIEGYENSIIQMKGTQYYLDNLK